MKLFIQILLWLSLLSSCAHLATTREINSEKKSEANYYLPVKAICKSGDSLVVNFYDHWITVEEDLLDIELIKIRKNIYKLQLGSTQDGGLSMSTTLERSVKIFLETEEICYLDHGKINSEATDKDTCQLVQDIPSCS